MYAQFFNLREMPFSIAPDPAYLYMSPRHQEALGHLLYGTGKYGGFVQLTGEVGTGKTTVVRTLLAQRLDNADVAMIHNPRQSEREFVQSICDEMGVSYDKANPTLKTLVDALNAHLTERHTAGRRTVLIIDEAQQLDADVLEQVRLLTNLETSKEKLLRIMLVGQPELSELLARHELRQLAQRITARYHLTPLSEEETGEYISHRLQVAGGARDLFSPAAMVLIHNYAGGIPRLVNILCDRALLGAYAQGLRQVTPELVGLAAAEVLGNQPPTAASTQPAAKPFHKPMQLPRGTLRWVEGALALAGLILAAVLLYRQWTPSAPDSAAVVAAAPIPKPVAAPTPPPAEIIRPVAEAYAPYNDLLLSLAQLWKPDTKLELGNKPCTALRALSLECYRAHAEWSDLMVINLPMLLTLSEGGDARYVLLTALSQDNATLQTPKGPLILPLTQLDPLWTGEYQLLWHRETSNTTISPDHKGEPILWLRKQVAARLGEPVNNPQKPSWDPQLTQSVRRVQAEVGARPSGIAGPRTLMALSSKPGPTLVAAPKAAP